jgi:branched-chain amino acid transport system substrate-binding protein
MYKKSMSALAAAALLLLSACGGEAGGNASDVGPAVTGDPIVIGTVGGFSGSQSASQALIDDAMQVWVDSVNHDGGVNGHPIKLVVKDDANDPAKALQAVKELVEQDKVQAIVGHASLVSTQWADYVTEKKIPVIGGPPVEITSNTEANFFPTGSNFMTLTVAQFVRMEKEGLSKMGLFYCAESPVCASLEGVATAAASLVGDDVGIAYSGKISQTQPSFTAECLAAKDAGVDAMFPATGSPTVIALAEACSKVGFNPVEVAQNTVFDNKSLASAPLDGSKLVSPTWNFLDESNETVKAYLDAVDTYAPDMRDSPQFTVNTFWSWLGGEMFKKAAENADFGPASAPDDLYSGLYQIKDETLGGSIAPTTYVKGEPTFVSCWFDIDISGSEFSSASDEPSCLTDEQVTGLQAILAGG